VTAGFDAFEVAYRPPPAESPFAKLLPAADADDRNLIRGAVRWLVQEVASAVTSELRETLKSQQSQSPLEKQYMVIDDTANKVRSQD
jgi:hypothetical protein